MASMVPPQYGVAFTFGISLVDQSNTKLMKSSATIASGDFKLSKDFGALANLTNLPTVAPASSKIVQISLTATEMQADNITIVCSDASGSEWADLVINIMTSARRIDDLAYPATTGRSVAVDASGQVTVGTMATDTVTSAALAASAVTEMQSGLSTLTAAGVRTAIGLATANLDTQLDALPTVAELATALSTADDATLAAIAGISLSGSTPAELWSYANRSLTQTAAQVQAAITGSNLSIVAAVTFTATLTGLDIGPTWTHCYFTIKPSSRLTYPDTDAKLQIRVTNGGAVGDGLLYLNGAVATANQASLVVNQGAGTVAISISDDATVQMVDDAYVYDLKVVMADGTSVLLTAGTVLVSRTATASIT